MKPRHSLCQGERVYLLDCSKSHTLAFSHRAGMSLQQSPHPIPVPKVGGGNEEDSNWTSRWEKPGGATGVSERGHSLPYCPLNKLKGEQMSDCSHGFYTAAWTQCIKTFRPTVLGCAGKDGKDHFHLTSTPCSARERDLRITHTPSLLLLSPPFPFWVKVRN